MKASSSELTVAGSGEVDAGKLASLLKAFTPQDGAFENRVPRGPCAAGVRANYGELVHAVQGPACCIVAQGAKSVTLGAETFDYDAARMLVFSADVPVSGMVTQASPTAPFLRFKMDLDPAKLADLVVKNYPHGLPRTAESRAVYVTPTEPGVAGAIGIKGRRVLTPTRLATIDGKTVEWTQKSAMSNTNSKRTLRFS